MSTQYQAEKVNTRLQLHQLVAGLWPYMKRYPWLLSGAILFTLVHVISARLIPISIGFAIDKGVTPKDMDMFLRIGVFFAVMQVTFTLSQFVYQYCFATLGNKALFDLRAGLLEHVQQLPLGYFHKNPTGRLVNRLTYDPNNLQDVFTEGLIHIVVQVLVLVSIVIAMLLISWKLTVIALFGVPLFLYLALKVTHQMRIHQRESKQQIGQISAYATERLQGLKSLQILGVIPDTLKQFLNQSNRLRDITLNMIRAGAKLHPVMNLATAVIISSLLMASGYFSTQESLSLGAITAMILHAQDFIFPLRAILERYQMFQNSLTSAERVFPIFTETPEVAIFEKPQDLIAAGPKAVTTGSVYFHDLQFKYNPEQDWIFNQASLEIKPGQKVALVGRTGAGKSTLVALLQGFYTPQAGQIQIDGTNLSSYKLDDLRQDIGVIQQDPFVFRGTLKENITIGNPGFNDEQILKQLEDLGLKSYFDRRGMPLDFWIDEKGQNISLGERQLINFVRIFIFNPKILIFDEATANMDSVTESFLQTALEKLIQNRTTIMIAHRLSTLSKCDAFYLVGHGQIKPVDLKTIEENPGLLD